MVVILNFYQVKSPVLLWIPILISIISLSTSLLVAYISNLKRSKPGVLIGSQIMFYPAPYQTVEKVIWGATGIYLPMTFFNWSPNGGSIIECRLIMIKLNNPNEIFDMGWYEFSEMLHNERRMGYSGFAQPIPLPPKSSIIKTIVFIWSPFSDKKLTIAEGRYSLNVLIWTKTSPKPNINQSFEFSISEQDAKDFQTSLQSERMLTIDVAIREINRRNSILTKGQASELYGL